MSVKINNIRLELDDPEEGDEERIEAAEILGVDAGASPDEVRAALRRRLEVERLHPDQGGDEESAKRLIAAKNLLIQRAREV